MTNNVSSLLQIVLPIALIASIFIRSRTSRTRIAPVNRQRPSISTSRRIISGVLGLILIFGSQYLIGGKDRKSNTHEDLINLAFIVAIFFVLTIVGRFRRRY
jgi:uncharacterized membrane protein YozB (DUF420 family)